MKTQKKPPTQAEVIAATGLSKSQIHKALKEEGIGPKDIPALKKYRGTLNTRSDDRPRATTPESGVVSGEMTLEQIETALKAKGISTNDARTLKIQLEGLKAATALRKEMNQLVSRDECREAWTKLGAAIGAALKTAESEIPRVCQGLTLAQSLPLAKAKMREIQEKLYDAESEFWAQRIEQ